MEEESMNRDSDRVRRVSAEAVNQQITDETVARLRAASASPGAIAMRLDELEREWDVERTLFALSSINVLLGLTAGALDRRWLAWPVTVAAFQFQHAVQGWCPPVSLLRRLGVRTRQEIDSERIALKALRGDFIDTAAAGGGPRDADRALAAATR
jgi:hypothetical protein